MLIALGLARQDGDRVAIDEGLRAVIGEGALGPFADDVFATIAAARAPAHRAAAELDQVVGWDGEDAVLVRAQGRNSETITKRTSSAGETGPVSGTPTRSADQRTCSADVVGVPDTLPSVAWRTSTRSR